MQKATTVLAALASLVLMPHVASRPADESLKTEVIMDTVQAMASCTSAASIPNQWIPYEVPTMAEFKSLLPPLIQCWKIILQLPLNANDQVDWTLANDSLQLMDSCSKAMSYMDNPWNFCKPEDITFKRFHELVLELRTCLIYFRDAN
uniref:Gsp_44 putative toxin n=1 Tax=Gemmula speciosa TaxID=439592 RepID=A0A098LXS4_GEMSP